MHDPHFVTLSRYHPFNFGVILSGGFSLIFAGSKVENLSLQKAIDVHKRRVSFALDNIVEGKDIYIETQKIRFENENLYEQIAKESRDFSVSEVRPDKAKLRLYRKSLGLTLEKAAEILRQIYPKTAFAQWWRWETEGYENIPEERWVAFWKLTKNMKKLF
ncbi:MAG: hypothetical protein LBG61_03370 [Burkholderiales bacterium]|nr:hypothetical protein [Burkholderiales bacterium]